MKKVLIPTDFSDNAWDALTYAIRSYDDIPCRFYILNTYQVSSSWLTNTMHKERNTHMYRVLMEESKKELKKIENFLNDNLLNDKHEYKIISIFGPLLRLMKQIVIKEEIDIIVMGTTGATGAKEIFMGSNTVKAIKEIDLCPIISVPLKYVYEEPERVAFANDLKRYFNEIELKCLIELQLIHNFEIRIITVNKGKELDNYQLKNKEILIKFFDESNTFFEEITSDSNITEAINNYVEEYKANMICLLNYEHSFIEKLTHEPIIKKISFHSNVPVLILPI